MLGTMKDFWTTFHSITKVHQRVPATMTNGVELASSDINKATLLNEIFNCSLASGIVQRDWKLSAVTPIFKSGDPAIVSNYRPISLLLTSKLLERLMHNALRIFIA